MVLGWFWDGLGVVLGWFKGASGTREQRANATAGFRDTRTKGKRDGTEQGRGVRCEVTVRYALSGSGCANATKKDTNTTTPSRISTEKS